MEIKKIYYTNDQMRQVFRIIMAQICRDNWRPDYVVGLNRGGLIPGVWASHWLDVPHYALDVSLRDNTDIGPESNCWMAGDAFENKNILIIDDINDQGTTFQWIKQDWKTMWLPSDLRWDKVWGNNVRTAVLINNVVSEWDVDYYGIEINKKEDPSWVIFPWEEF